MKQNSTTNKESTQQSPASQEQVAQRAYEIWLANGQPVGRDLDYWLQAEAELRLASQTSRAGMHPMQCGSGRENTATIVTGGTQTDKSQKSKDARFSGAASGRPNGN